MPTIISELQFFTTYNSSNVGLNADFGLCCLGVFMDYNVEPCVGEWGSTALIGFALSLMNTPSADYGKFVRRVFLASNMCRRYISCPVDRCPAVLSRDPLHYGTALKTNPSPRLWAES